jgi:hypothetical protein
VRKPHERQLASSHFPQTTRDDFALRLPNIPAARHAPGGPVPARARHADGTDAFQDKTLSYNIWTRSVLRAQSNHVALASPLSPHGLWLPSPDSPHELATHTPQDANGLSLGSSNQALTVERLLNPANATPRSSLLGAGCVWNRDRRRVTCMALPCYTSAVLRRSVRAG